MPTKHPRINVTFTEQKSHFLENIAHQEDKSVSMVVRELTLEALSLREDKYFSLLAEERDVPNSPTISHDDAWQ